MNEEEYNPNEKQEIEQELEDFKQEIEGIRKKLEPYQKPLAYICVILILLVVGFFGFAAGGLVVCNQVTGFLDKGFTCHLDYFPNGTSKEVKDPYNFSQIKIEGGLKKHDLF